MKRRLIKYNGRNLYGEQIAHLKGYCINKDGDVFYKDRKRKPSIYCGGYKKIKIRLDSLSFNLKYHRLQAYQKYGDKIYRKGIVVRHLDNNPSNNSFSNIAIGTASQNCYDSFPEVRHARAQKGGDKIRKHDHKYIINLRNKGLSYKEIMKYVGISSKGTLNWILNHSTESKSAF